MLLVDGHNVIGRARGLSLSDEERSREELLRRIAAAKGSGGERVVVFFDGDRPQGSRESFGGLAVVYAPANRTADREIVRRLEAASGQQVTVVTSDRELARRVRARGASTLTIEAFWQRLTQPTSSADSRGNEPPKPAPSPGDVDHWLEIFDERAKK